jgi:hypothetical protein
MGSVTRCSQLKYLWCSGFDSIFKDSGEAGPFVFGMKS